MFCDVCETEITTPEIQVVTVRPTNPTEIVNLMVVCETDAANEVKDTVTLEQRLKAGDTVAVATTLLTDWFEGQSYFHWLTIG